MAIKRMAGSGNYFTPSDSGEHRVTVEEATTKKSSKGDPMLVVKFKDANDREISAWFVKKEKEDKGTKYHKYMLDQLKIAAGLSIDRHHEELVGKQIGILIEPQKPNEKGQIFMQIVGYGPAADVSSPPEMGVDKKYSDEIPF